MNMETLGAGKVLTSWSRKGGATLVRVTEVGVLGGRSGGGGAGKETRRGRADRS